VPLQSSTRNIKLGVCRAYYDGIDLGLTQGGVEVSVTSETHKVEVDQFGKTPVNEYIMGRVAQAKVPMAEPTLDNLVAIMPGATLTETGGTKASGTLTITATMPTNGQTVIVNGVTITFKTVPVTAYDVLIGASATAQATSLVAALNALTDPAIAIAQYTNAAGVVTVTYNITGAEGNAFTLAAGTYVATVSGATLTGGADATSRFVSVGSGVGNDLLATAKELRLHPVGKPNTDRTDDFVMPLSNTAGQLQFAYKLDAERIFNVEFTGYADPVTGLLFTVGK
jgi:hypothetical protein